MGEKQNSFRWYDFNVYGEKGSVTNKEIARNLRNTYAALFKVMGEANDLEMTLDEMEKIAKGAGREEKNGTLEDLLGKMGINQYDENKNDRKEVKNEKETQRKNISEKAKKSLERLVKSGEITPVQEAIIQAYLQAFESYGTGARDNVLTSATMLTTKGVNARIGCGQGKTDISKAWAMAKKTENKRAFITTSTPELAAQSFKESFKGMNQAGLKVAYISGTKIMYAKGEKDEDGKFVSVTKELSELSEKEIKEILSEANVVISDLTSLVVHRESGLYEPNKEKDVLLQDEQDEALFNNLWNVEIKGEAYDKDTHDLRLAARKAADDAVAKLGDSLKGNKISQSVSINGKAPDFEVNGNKIKIVGTDVEIEIQSGIDELEMQEFLLDAMLANKVFNEAGKDYVVVDGEVKAISPSTGSKEDIPEGVMQAIAVNEKLIDVQPEHKVKNVVSKMSILKECFSEISGMSATYGQLGSEVSKEFLEVLSRVGVSPELIPVLEVFKESGSIPNFENMKEPPKGKKNGEIQEDLVIAEENEIKEKVTLTIDGKKIEKELPPHIAAIVRDIEAHPDEAIIIATNDREMTIELTKALQEAYEHKKAKRFKKNKETDEIIEIKPEEDAIQGYSGVPQENGDPKLYAPPNPANDEKLNITPPRIIIGDHSIGRGVTPFDENDFYNADCGKSINGEHLIVAQMPSRSEALLEQFLGRVGRKKINGSVAFVLSSKDDILKEYFEKNGKNPEKATQIIEELYPSKTKDALESTKADIDISRALIQRKYLAMKLVIASTLSKNVELGDINKETLREANKIAENPELLEKFLEENPEAISTIETISELFNKKASFLYKKYKADDKSLLEDERFFDVEIAESALEKTREKSNNSKQKDVVQVTKDSRFSNVMGIMQRAKELSTIYDKEESGKNIYTKTEEDKVW